MLEGVVFWCQARLQGAGRQARAGPKLRGKAEGATSVSRLGLCGELVQAMEVHCLRSSFSCA